MKLVEPHNHRVNALERLIQIFKNNLISGLNIGDEKLPTILWSYFVTHTQDSLNILRTSRVHRQLSAFQVLEGTHDYNRHPCTPPETRKLYKITRKLEVHWGPEH